MTTLQNITSIVMMTPHDEPSLVKRPSVRLTADEAWEVIVSAHTAIFTSLRSDGVPIALPTWFVVEDGAIFITTPSRAKKVARVRHDPRTSFLVETGQKWAELRAVHLTCTAEVLEGEIAEWANAKKNEKYAAYRTPREDMPEATKSRYEVEWVAIRLSPDERILSWDNSRLGSAQGGASGRR